MTKFIWIFIGVLVVLAACAGAWRLMRRPPPQKQSAPAPAVVQYVFAGKNTPLPFGPHRTPPAGESEFYNQQYRFSLLYPADLSVQSVAEQGDTGTFTFEDASTSQGFQIFVEPYDGSQVSEAQFAKDEPSGVRDNMQNISIDGATGASFFGSDPTLGQTAEVWFIHGGYLYEVTTLEPLAGWLSTIMQSWKFI